MAATAFSGPLYAFRSPARQAHPDWIQGMPRTLVGQDLFFGPAGAGPAYDWPNPRGAVPSLELWTFLNPVKIHLIGQDQFFGLAGNPTYEWPLPQGHLRVGDLRMWLENLLQSTLAPSAQAPFYLLEWPNPDTQPRSWNVLQQQVRGLSPAQIAGAASTPNTLGVRVDAAPEDTANVVARRISQPSS